MQSLGWIVERSGKTKVFIKKLGPFSLIKIQRPKDLDLSDVDRLARKYRALLVKIEPDINAEHRIPALPAGWLNTEYSADNWPLLPTKSLILDLDSPTLDSLPKDTRYEIRKTQKNSLSLGLSNDCELFYKLLQETMKLGGWSVPIRKEVKNLYQAFQPSNSVLLFAHLRSSSFNVPGSSSSINNPVAACLLIWHKDTAHYMYAATTKEGRRLGAAYLILWKAIQFCKKKKLKYLDLEGVYDERYPKQTKAWLGFTKFKMGWGGKVVQYPGSYTKYYNTIVKLLFRLTGS